VKFGKLGLGFREKRRRSEEQERETLKKWGKRILSFFISLITGSVWTRPTLTRCRPFDLGLLDPDQSDASGAFWRSGSVCVIGFWAFYPWILVLFTFSWISCAIHTPLLAIWTSMCVDFLAKIPKNLPYVSWYIFLCFVMFSHFKVDKKHVR